MTGLEVLSFNNSTFLINQTAVITARTDLDVVANLCVQYRDFVLVFCSLTIIMLLAKLVVGRCLGRFGPRGAVYDFVDGWADLFLLFLTVVLLCLHIWGWQ
jgi:ABC-type microcin C transport system permease subunit YejE